MSGDSVWSSSCRARPDLGKEREEVGFDLAESTIEQQRQI
jgi:hypothetical protein